MKTNENETVGLQVQRDTDRSTPPTAPRHVIYSSNQHFGKRSWFMDGWRSPRGKESIKAAADIHGSFFSSPAAVLPHSKPNYSDVMSCASGAGPRKCWTRQEHARRSDRALMSLNTSRIFTGSVDAVSAAPASQRARPRPFYEGKDTNWFAEKLLVGALCFLLASPHLWHGRSGGKMNCLCALTKLIDTHECSAARGQSCRKRRPGKKASEPWLKEKKNLQGTRTPISHFDRVYTALHCITR